MVFARWRANELAAGHTVSTAGRTVSLACWLDDELTAGWTMGLTHLRDGELAAGQTAELACLVAGTYHVSWDR